MCKNEQSIHYCTILSAGQWDFLLDGKAAIDRQKCLHRLMTAAVRTKTVLRIKGVEIELEVGQAAASDVKLAEYMGCNRKTIGKLIDSFNRLGMLTTRTNNRTSVHTQHPFHHSQVERNDMGSFTSFDYTLIVTDELVDEILALGDKVEITFPEKLRMKLLQKIGRIKNRYII